MMAQSSLRKLGVVYFHHYDYEHGGKIITFSRNVARPYSLGIFRGNKRKKLEKILATTGTPGKLKSTAGAG